jgi:hypothetical protein
MTDSTLPTHSLTGTASSRPGTAVTAVVVTHGVTRYLATTLAAVAAQTRVPGQVLVVDVSAEHDAGVPQAAGAAFAASGPESPGSEGRGVHPPEVLSVHAPGARTFGDAVQRALAGLSADSHTAAVVEIAVGEDVHLRCVFDAIDEAHPRVARGHHRE